MAVARRSPVAFRRPVARNSATPHDPPPPPSQCSENQRQTNHRAEKNHTAERREDGVKKKLIRHARSRQASLQQTFGTEEIFLNIIELYLSRPV